MVVLVQRRPANIVLTENLGRLLGLEGCISGNRPKDLAAPGGPKWPCAEFARTKPVKVVYGPGTFINSAVGEIHDAARRAARQHAAAGGAREAGGAQAGEGEGRSRRPTRTRPRAPRSSSSTRSSRATCSRSTALRARAEASCRGSTTPTSSPRSSSTRRAARRRRRRASPTCSRTDKAAVIQVRLKPDLTERAAAARDRAGPRGGGDEGVAAQNGVSYTVTGAPVLVEDLTAALTDSLLRLLVVALLVMAMVLALVFRSRLRLLPLAVALAAVAITFGLMSLFGASLTMASIAVLPVLLGLGVDYAIQYQARVEEEAATRAHRAHRGADDRHRRRWPRSSASSCCCCRRCRWCAGSACCWWSASCSRSSSRSARAPRRWGDRAAARGRRAARRLGARGGRARRRAGRARVAPARAAAAARRRGRARPRCAARSSGRSACC